MAPKKTVRQGRGVKDRDVGISEKMWLVALLDGNNIIENRCGIERWRSRDAAEARCNAMGE